MKKQKLNKGITLVALIITIIILLVLATVSIKLLIDQGIIGRAESATERYTVAEEKEKINLSYADYKMSKVENGNATLIVEGATVTGDKTSGWTITFEKTGNKYMVGATGKVEEYIEVGSYIHYDIEYVDMYSGQTFNANNGWRYLGKDDAGNNLIVSTGIPEILYYSSDGTNGTWWDSNEELNPNERAANGMKNNFENIPFSYKATGTSVSTKNTGIFRKVGVATNGTLPSTAFRADGVRIIGVHNLTLEELNRATNKASGSNRADTSTAAGFKDLEGTALGLFDMEKLDGSGAGTNYYYWLASPNPSGASGVCSVYSNYSYVTSDSGSYYFGVRPVVYLSPDVPLSIVE